MSIYQIFHKKNANKKKSIFSLLSKPNTFKQNAHQKSTNQLFSNFLIKPKSNKIEKKPNKMNPFDESYCPIEEYANNEQEKQKIEYAIKTGDFSQLEDLWEDILFDHTLKIGSNHQADLNNLSKPFTIFDNVDIQRDLLVTNFDKTIYGKTKDVPIIQIEGFVCC